MAEITIYTTIGEACVCVCAKFDQFLPVRPHFDTTCKTRPAGRVRPVTRICPAREMSLNHNGNRPTACHRSPLHILQIHYTRIPTTQRPTLHYTTCTRPAGRVRPVTRIHYTTLHYITLHYITLHYTTLHTLHHTTPHHTTPHHTTPHHTTPTYIRPRLFTTSSPIKRL